MNSKFIQQGEEALDALLSNDALMDRLAREAVLDTLRDHKRRGQSVVVWQDGKVVTLAPEDIPVDDEAPAPQ